jgi:hypothetical protein
MIRVCLVCLFSLISFLKVLYGQSLQNLNLYKDTSANAYPTPPANKYRLFYIQRTHNINTIIYEVNYNKDSTINETEPIKIYWIRYADKGEILPLTNVQKTFAYGVNAKLIDKKKKSFLIKLKAYDKREIYLIKTKPDRTTFQAFININGKLSVLSKIFIKTEGGTFWRPNVLFVELTGVSPTTGKIVSERFKP